MLLIDVILFDIEEHSSPRRSLDTSFRTNLNYESQPLRSHPLAFIKSGGHKL